MRIAIEVDGGIHETVLGAHGSVRILTDAGVEYQIRRGEGTAGIKISTVGPLIVRPSVSNVVEVVSDYA